MAPPTQHLNPSPSPSPSPGPSPSTISQHSNLLTPRTAADLRQALHLLTLAAHRNKNQHRRSRWWKELGVLRRNVRRLVGVLGGGGKDGRGRGGRQERGKEEEKKKEKGKEKVWKADVEGEIRKRVRFLREWVVPRAWIAFSGLVADGQYAGLGMMLVGVLGRVVGLLGGVVSEDGGEGKREAEMGDGEVEREEEEERLEASGGEDLGMPVVREKVVVMSEEVWKKGNEREGQAKSDLAIAHTDKSTAKKKRKKGHQDPFDELFSGLI